MPRFSIIITCYNQGDLIREAVDSALAQNHSDREIIVVDDGSSDGSGRALAAYGGSITVELLARNGGADLARNRGAALARGDFLVFLDGDDRLLPWALDVYSRVAGLKRPALILAQMHFFADSLPTEAVAGLQREIRLVMHQDYFQKDRPFRASASAMVIERGAFNQAGGWTDGTFPADDQDLLFKLGCAGPVVQLVAPQTAAYRTHGTNATRSVQPLIGAVYGLLEREQQGRYPGGRARRFERRAVIGGFLFFLVRRAGRARLYREGGKLLWTGWPFVFAAVWRRGTTRLRGRRPEEILAEPSPGA